MKQPEHTVIVLCGGDINASNLPIATSGSNALIPVNGKPVIGWILDDLVQKQVHRVILVTQSKNVQLLNFVQWAFQGRLAFEFALLEQKGNIIHSLCAGIEQLGNAESVTVLLGDTLISEPFPQDQNCVSVSNDFDDPRNWCLVETNSRGVVCQYFDKTSVQREGLIALAGLYRFSDVTQLSQACDTSLAQGGKELSDVLLLYGQRYPIHAVPASSWYDFGHMPHFLKAKRELLQSRYFNHLRIEEVVGIVRKSSTRTEKLSDEYDWYCALPDELKVLTPRVLSKQEHGGTFTLVQEYYGYPNMAELYLYGNFDLEIWKVAIQNLMQAHLLLKSHPGQVGPKDAMDIYWAKTSERLAELQGHDGIFRELLSLQHIVLNGQKLANLPLLTKGIQDKCAYLADSVQGAIIHGDFCLSNILYDVNNQIVRLIDPRGSFGEKGIYGDPRYDMAKLRHSFCGGYDFILADLFSLEIKEKDKFESDIFGGEQYDEIGRLVDTAITGAGYVLLDIIFIEALLFLSMIPLHQGKPDRQLMMYLTAIKTLNALNITPP